LRIVKAVFESYESDSSQENSESSVFEKLIEKGLEDSEAGRVRPHSAVMEDVRKRYNL
jgi:predicted transcriptional regulator